MALPSSGQISMNDIRIELGVPSQSPFGLNEARNGTYVTINPCSTYKPPSTGQISLSSWYGYNQTESCGCVCWYFVNEGGSGATVNYTACGGSATFVTLNPGVTRYRCVADGTTPYTGDPAVTIVQCGSPGSCTVSTDCNGCT